MPTNRENIQRGPAAIKLGEIVIHSTGGIEQTNERTYKDIPSDMTGVLDRHMTDRMLKLSLTPTGAVTTGLLAALYPYGQPVIGGSIFGSSDTPLEIHTRAGKKITLACAAITKLPQLFLRATGDLFGSMEYTAVVAKGKAASETGGLIEVVDLTYALGVPSKPNMSGKTYAGVYGTGDGSRTFAATEDGFVFSPNVQLRPETVDAEGTIDYTITGGEAEIRFRPKDVGELEAIALAGLKSAIGSSSASGKDFVVSASGGLVVTLKNVTIMSVPQSYATDKGRSGEIVVSANPDSNGLLYTVAIAS